MQDGIGDGTVPQNSGASPRSMGGSAIKLIAAQGPIEMQAQSESLALRALDSMKLTSAQAHIDLAAAKSIKIGVAGGAYILIENGNIDFHCPGTIRIQAGQKSLSGPGRMNYKLPIMPSGVCIECLKKRATQRSALVNQGA